MKNKLTQPMLFDPYTGRPRRPSDIASDPQGILMLDPDEPLRPYVAQPDKDAEIAALKLLLRDVSAVAITMLYDTHRDDVLAEFSLPDLRAISRASEPLQPQKVEAIYRRGFDAAIAQAVQP